MLTIVPVDEDRRQVLIRLYQEPEIQAMTARSKEGEEGEGVYIIQNGVLLLLELWAHDDPVRDGLLRAVLNAGRHAGAKYALCREERLSEFLLAEGFSPTEDGMQTDIFAFFARPCRGGMK